MCTSFVYREKNILIGMNLDNDGKEYQISSYMGNDFLVSIKMKGRYFPSFGISRAGTFVNDLMVDSNGEGQYKRQSEKRWISNTLVQRILGDQIPFDALMPLLEEKEIVNNPGLSTHNMIANIDGTVIIVEPGRKNILSGPKDSSYYIMTNFPLSGYDGILPQHVSGSGSDRYLETYKNLSQIHNELSPKEGFDILKKAQQTGPEWTTELSLIYNPVLRQLYFTFDCDYETVFEFEFATNTVYVNKNTSRERSVCLTNKGVSKDRLKESLPQTG
ncbi:hypothetical protein JXI42_10605 [bacterium]|nr:hypothetical protein [bacterium]